MASSSRSRCRPLRDFNQSNLEDFQLPTKCKKSQFSDPKSSDEMDKLGKGPVVPNTDKSTAWAVRVFNEWKNKAVPLWKRNIFVVCHRNVLLTS